METYEQVKKVVRNMSSEDRYNLVIEILKITDEDNDSEFLIEAVFEIMNMKKDIEYLSRKIGVHELYLNRINKEIEEISTPNK
ncbi:hypothetical protein ACE198_23705 [Neobacillus sp. KR4-4]|uniref:hypothetical protein n=1 Tax=Neobacillus sp. KR4-4 TaxID=3344872 RepID=UPI0035CBDB75